MKKLLPLIFISLSAYNINAQGYRINLQSNYRSGIAYITYYMGTDYLLQDSAAVSNTGLAVFKGETKLPGGIYSIIFPGKRLTADFLIDKEQVLTIQADTNHLDKIIITGSPVNNVFRDYRTFADAKGRQLQQEKTAYSNSRTHADSLRHEAAYKKYGKELNDYRQAIITGKPSSLMAVLFNAMKDPSYPTKIAVTHSDSLNNYNYFKDHYWDGITFMDDRIIRSPFFLPKLQTYYRQVMSQSSDSLMRDIDYKLLLARSNPEMYKFLLNWFTDEYLNPKYMGQDAVFVHLFEQYHSKGASNWLSEKQHEAISRRAYMLMSNLIGEKAANLEFADTAGNPKALYDAEAPYTVVVFWDPNCGHCKTEIPVIDSFYRAAWQKKNVKMYAVLTESEKEKGAWTSFIRAHNIGDWTNVYQTKEAADKETKSQFPSYRQLYDITLTPTLYLLDKDKRIIAKKLTPEQINDLLNVKFSKARN